MKRLLPYIVTLLLFAACTTTQGFKDTVIIDYERYYKQGFFLTESNSVSFDYMPIGSAISVVKGSKYVEAVETAAQMNDSTFLYSVKSGTTDNRVESQSFSVYNALDEVIERCKDKGADGIINLKITATYDRVFGRGYDITGMAIKRKLQNIY